MPILSTLDDPANVFDPDALPQRVFTFSMTLQTEPVTLDVHRHRKAQLLMAERGALTCGVAGGLWMVPPRGALWIPSNALHDINGAVGLHGYGVFIEPDAVHGLPETCCTLSVTPLLRELVIRSADFPLSPTTEDRQARIFSVLLDEIAAAPIGGLYLPMPAEPRLRAVIDAMMAEPANRNSMAEWARRAGLSERSMARILDRETGMSFGRWRRQLAVILAVQRLVAGATVQQVAADLGYESPGSFVAMFRKTLGMSPARYVAREQSRSQRPGDS